MHINILRLKILISRVEEAKDQSVVFASVWRERVTACLSAQPEDPRDIKDGGLAPTSVGMIVEACIADFGTNMALFDGYNGVVDSEVTIQLVFTYLITLAIIGVTSKKDSGELLL